MRFWDASAVIALCVDEPNSAALAELGRDDKHIIAWWGTVVECRSAFARLRREGAWNQREEDSALELLFMLSASWTEIQPSDPLRDIAGRLLFSHPLRATDSLQLAAGLIWVDRIARNHPFVCLDPRLRGAARNEGFAVLPAEVSDSRIRKRIR